jgi:hypothetical protein
MGLLGRLFGRLTLQEAAAELGGSILAVTQESGRAILKLVAEKEGESSGPPPSHLEVQADFLCFYAHLVDRVAFTAIGPERRSQLMDLIFPNLAQSLAITYFPERPDAQREYSALMLRTMDEFSAEYMHYPTPREGASLKGTLLWEFGKRLSRTLGRENDPWIVTAAGMLNGTMVKALGIRETLSKVR